MTDFTFRPMTTFPRTRTPKDDRRYYPFRSGGQPVTYTHVLRGLQRELAHLGAERCQIETFHPRNQIRNDGLPRDDAPRPPDPGVVISFEGKHGPLRFACDSCHRWEDNLRAIALTMERLRLADLYGVTSKGEQYRGWSQLPPPGAAIVTPPSMTVEQAAEFVGLRTAESAEHVLRSPDSWRAAYREAAKLFHPDANEGTELKDWHQLQTAKAVLDAHHGA